MQFGVDDNGARVHIDSSMHGRSYYCPTCGHRLVMKKGDVKVHHFAHYPGSDCTDDWHYDGMSPWHQGMQDLFDKQYQEIVVTYDGKTHRADVLCDGTVIEFQHSDIMLDEVNDRIQFFLGLGYRVVWVFDIERNLTKFEDVCSDEDVKLFCTEWSHAWNRFDRFDFSNPDRLALWFCGYGEDKFTAFRVKYPAFSENNGLRFHSFRLWDESGLDLSPGSEVSVDDFFDMKPGISMCRDVCEYHGKCV